MRDLVLTLPPNKSPEPTAVGPFSSAFADLCFLPAWLFGSLG